MPGFDGTGPTGRGPISGRGLGPCRGSNKRGRFFARSLTKEEEKKVLEAEKEEINKRLKELGE